MSTITVALNGYVTLWLKFYQWLPITPGLKFKVLAMVLHDLASGLLSDLIASLGIFVPAIPSALNTLHKAFTSFDLLFTCHHRKVFPVNSIKSAFCHLSHWLFISLPALFSLIVVIMAGLTLYVFIHLFFYTSYPLECKPQAFRECILFIHSYILNS